MNNQLNQDIKSDVLHTQTQKLKCVIKCIGVAIGFFLLVLILAIQNRTIHIDTMWLSEQAYWLAKDGYVHSYYFSSFIGYDIGQYVYHKLFIWLGSLIISVRDFYLPWLRAISLLFLLGAIVVLWPLSRAIFKESLVIRKKPPEPEQLLNRSTPNVALGSVFIFGFSMLTLIANHQTVRFSFEYRPESMLMLLGLLTFFSLQRYLANPAKLKLIGLAMLSGIAVLTHLNGLIFAAAVGVILLYHKKYAPFLVFTVLSGLVAAFYFIDVLVADAWSQFWHQFANDPAITEDHFDKKNLFYNLLAEHKRYFRSESSITWTLMGAGFFWLCKDSLKASINNLRQSNSIIGNLILYTLVCAICLGLIAISKTEKYLLLVAGPLTLLIGLCSYQIFLSDRKQQLIGAALLLLFLAGQLTSTISYMKVKEPLAQIWKQFDEQLAISKADMVLAPMILLSATHPQKNHRSQKLLELYLFREKKPLEESLKLITGSPKNSVSLVMILDKITQSKIGPLQVQLTSPIVKQFCIDNYCGYLLRLP